MAALLIKDRVKGSKRRQQKALQRLMDPVKGNLLVQLTLTCLEREIASSQPTIPSCSTHPDSESDDDVVDGATLLNPPEFTGAAVSMLPPGDEAEAIIDDVPVIGSTISRLNNEESLHEAETTSANPTVEALTFPTLMNAKGGFRNTPSGCTHRHYIHKTFGSVAHHCARAQEFVWYHYQDKVRRSTFGNKSRRMVGGHIATKANESDLKEHKSDVQEQWDVIAKEFPEFVPKSTLQETYTGGVAKTVVGSKAYWCSHIS